MGKDNLKGIESNGITNLVDTINKIIYDVNLLMEKVKNLEEFKRLADKEIFELRADDVDLKADDAEIKKTVLVLGKEVRVLEHEVRKLNEHINKIEERIKAL